MSFRPVVFSWAMSDQPFAAAEDVGESHEAYHATSPAMVWLAWIAVGIPLAWGVYRTLLSAGKFFN